MADQPCSGAASATDASAPSTRPLLHVDARLEVQRANSDASTLPARPSATKTVLGATVLFGVENR